MVNSKFLEELGTLDIFHNNSLHAYEYIMFEYRKAWRKLNKGGLLIPDNIDLNNAFKDFCKEIKASPGSLVNVGFALKK
jgi:hypothetical protein